MSGNAGDEKRVEDWTTAEFLARSAGPSPTPGGGSVSAYTGALAAAMICMAANLTLGKEKYREAEPLVNEIFDQGRTLLELCQKGVNEDMAEFACFMKAFKMPKGTEAEKKQRRETMQSALISATDTPLAVSRNCLKILQLAKDLAPIGNATAISDVGVAAYLAESALKSALFSVDINLPQIQDQSYRLRVKMERNRLLSEGAALCAEAVAAVQERILSA